MTTTERVTLAAPGFSSVRVTMDADDPRRGRLIGLGWRQVWDQTGPYDQAAEGRDGK